MRKKPLISLFLPLFVVVFTVAPAVFAHSAFAAPARDRGPIIEAELTRASDCLKNSGDLGWSDVCYDLAEHASAGQSARSARDEAINKELSDYAQILDQEAREPGSILQPSEPVYDKKLRDVDLSEIDSQKSLPLPFTSEELPAETPNRAFGELKIKTENYKIEYEEPNFMSHKGYMHGVAVSYTARLSDRSLDQLSAQENKIGVLRADGRFAMGYVDYKSYGTGTMDGQENYSGEIRLVGGYELKLAEALITPYFGGGYRYLYNDARGTTSTGHIGYRRQSLYFYLPLGLDIQKRFSDDWQITLNGEYDFFVYGTQKTYLGDVHPGYDSLENHQGKGFGCRGSLEILKEGKTMDIFFEPFIRYWDIEDSELSYVTWEGQWIVGAGIEPKNNTKELGLKMGVRF